MGDGIGVGSAGGGGGAVNTWDGLHVRAKRLEAQLEVKVQQYSSVVQKINADFLCDEENPLMEGRQEHDLAADIEHALSELSECINSMQALLTGPGSGGGVNSPVAATSNILTASQKDSIIKRYREIHFDYSSEFKNASMAVYRKRESMELFHRSSGGSGSGGGSGGGSKGAADPAVDRLLKERSSVAASLRSINDVISQAFETRSALSSQRASLSAAASGLSGLSSNVPSLGRIIDGIHRKKTKEFVVIALVVATLMCFSIWWMFLR